MIPELLQDHSRTELFSTVVGDDVVAATLKLGQVLHSKQLADGFFATSIPQSRNKRSNIKMELDRPSSSLQSYISLPDLPLILDPSLERAVFTHRGTMHNDTDINEGYERLEFLGDAYLKQIACQLAYDMFPASPPGRLSHISQNLVRNETLARFSAAYKFDERIKLHPHHLNSEKGRMKLLGDVFEAYSAAIVLSYPQNGVTILEEWMKKLWVPKLNELKVERSINLTAKVELAQRIMSKGMKIEYREVAPPQLDNGGATKSYTFGVFFTGWTWVNEHLGTGSGLNMKEAGNRAAMEALSNPTTARIEAAKKNHDTAAKLQREQQSVLAGKASLLVGTETV